MELHNKIWWTRKSKIHAERRLLSNDLQTQLVLLWYALFSVAISIYYLIVKSSSTVAPGVWVVLSVFSLVASGFISGLNYKNRAALIKECYEKLDSLFQEAKLSAGDVARQGELAEKYRVVLSLCENHSDIDYRAARCEMHFSGDREFSPEIGFYDYFRWVSYKLLRFGFLLVIYISPVAVFLLLEVDNVLKCHL
ncbi:SLATT domain-containing protein [Pseudomonas nitroreducens]|uniref:SLATT domain-containing protein n=1 Tax=Pseudomonas nitroreducens TaxID=46680 RepID=A0ABS0KK72_PSENT|nr:SLATT domain-containing protein [Pseudomonas nitroreducens]MBG6288492.1 SLATT domain-containing protein [Pseudomonas nitroreducens]